MKVVRFSAPSIYQLYPQMTLLIPNSVRGWVNPRDIVRPEWLRQLKISKTPMRIEPATFRLVALCLKQLRHYRLCKILDMSRETEVKLRNVWVRTGDLRDGTWVWRMVCCTVMFKHFTCSQRVREPMSENHHIQRQVEKRENKAPDTSLRSI
jgi:hypothetical protein